MQIFFKSSAHALMHHGYAPVQNSLGFQTFAPCIGAFWTWTGSRCSRIPILLIMHQCIMDMPQFKIVRHALPRFNCNMH
ncbi:hypothetical protein A2U01_0049418, partial [Trifolium medium]|nr:hypothetical protein [Trifolium medium]